MQTATSIQPSARIALTGKVTCRGQTSSAAVVDLGSNSITLRLSYDIKATEGQAVSIDRIVRLLPERYPRIVVAWSRKTFGE